MTLEGLALIPGGSLVMWLLIMAGGLIVLAVILAVIAWPKDNSF